MKAITLDISQAEKFAPDQFKNLADAAAEALTDVNTGRAAGNDFLGWVRLLKKLTRLFSTASTRRQIV